MFGQGFEPGQRDTFNDNFGGFTRTVKQQQHPSVRLWSPLLQSSNFHLQNKGKRGSLLSWPGTEPPLL
jgi:hypothetical protein